MGELLGSRRKAIILRRWEERNAGILPLTFGQRQNDKSDDEKGRCRDAFWAAHVAGVGAVL
jgi:hypothetical protein